MSVFNAGMSDFMRSCVLGEVEAVRTALAAARADGGDTLFHLLERGELHLRIPPLHAIIVQVARLLLDAGARADAKDIAGYTLFHRCTCEPMQACDVLLEIGHWLIGSRSEYLTQIRGCAARGGDRTRQRRMHLAAAGSGCQSAPEQLWHRGHARSDGKWIREHARSDGNRPYPDVQDDFRHALTRKSMTGTQRLQDRILAGGVGEL